MFTLWHLDGRKDLYTAKQSKFYEMPGSPYPTRQAASTAASEFIRQGKLTAYSITSVGKTPADPIGA